MKLYTWIHLPCLFFTIDREGERKLAKLLFVVSVTHQALLLRPSRRKSRFTESSLSFHCSSCHFGGQRALPMTSAGHLPWACNYSHYRCIKCNMLMMTAMSVSFRKAMYFFLLFLCLPQSYRGRFGKRGEHMAMIIHVRAFHPLGLFIGSLLAKCSKLHLAVKHFDTVLLSNKLY